MPFYQTPYTRSAFPKRYEKNVRPSQTVPDKNLTMTEIIERHMHGLPITGGHVGFYESDYDDADGELFPDLDAMDLAERDVYIQEARDRIAEIRARAREESEQRKAAKEAARLQKAKAELYDEQNPQKEAQQGPIIERTTGGAADQRTKP